MTDRFWGGSLATDTLPQTMAELIEAMRTVGAAGAYYWCLGHTEDEALGLAASREHFTIGPRESLLRTLGALGRAWRDDLPVSRDGSTLIIAGERYPWHELTGARVTGRYGELRTWDPGHLPEIRVEAEPRRGILSRFFSLFRD